MKIEQNFVLDVPIGPSWSYIRDPQFVASCLPGCENVETLSPISFLATIRVTLGPFNMRFVLEVDLVSEIVGQEVRFRCRGEEGGRASTVSSENILRLEPSADARTNVHYSADVLVVGRLGRFGLGVMRKKTISLGEEFAAQFAQRVKSEVSA